MLFVNTSSSENRNSNVKTYGVIFQCVFVSLEMKDRDLIINGKANDVE